MQYTVNICVTIDTPAPDSLETRMELAAAVRESFRPLDGMKLFNASNGAHTVTGYQIPTAAVDSGLQLQKARL